MHLRLVCVLGSIAGFVLVASAADPPLPKGPTFSGVVRFQDRAVAKATVWLLGNLATTSGSGAPEQHRTTTDEKGQFTLPLQYDWHHQPHLVLASDSQGRLGWLNVQFNGDLALEPALRVELLDVGEARGRLTDATGAPIRKARVRVEKFGSPPDAFGESGTPWSPDGSFAAKFETVSTDDGNFVIRGVPRQASITAVVSAGFRQFGCLVATGRTLQPSFATDR